MDSNFSGNGEYQINQGILQMTRGRGGDVAIGHHTHDIYSAFLTIALKDILFIA